jgi:hypothetical protein
MIARLGVFGGKIALIARWAGSANTACKNRFMRKASDAS